MHRRFSIVALLLLSQSVLADQAKLEEELMQLMSLEVDITSAMKRAQPIKSTPASIFVLEREDILMSGYATLPELLKLIPGIDARRIDNNQWAVSVRSAASKFNSNLMVMMDGRNVSEPVINTIFWETLSYPAQDIERIELVRGAAGSLWGHSANNGILNIITRHSHDTQGIHVKLTAGDPVNHSAEIRYGNSINDEMTYRVFGMQSEGRRSGDKIYRERFLATANDDHQKRSFGGQFDYQYGDKNAFKVQVQHGSGEYGILERDVDMTNFGLLYSPRHVAFELDTVSLKIDHSASDNLKVFSQLAYNDFEANTGRSGSDYRSMALNTALNARWDGGFFSAGFDLESNEGSLHSVGGSVELDAKNSGFFLQNEASFFDDKLKVLIGSRWDRLKVYGTEVSPNIRFNYSYSELHSMWGAYSRGNRIMIDSDEDKQLVVMLPNESELGILELFRAQTADAIEHATTTEFGYRYSTEDILLTVALFDIDYKSQFVGYQSIDLSQGFPIRWLDVDKSASGQSYGADFVLKWQPKRAFSLMLGLSIIDHQLNDVAPNNRNFSPNDFSNYQYFSRLRYHVTENVTTQALVKHISKNSSAGSAAYSIVDLAVHWQLNEQFKISMVGQNLADDDIVEFPYEAELFNASTAVGRNIHLSVSFLF